jgi:hypothetical protein
MAPARAKHFNCKERLVSCAASAGSAAGFQTRGAPWAEHGSSCQGHARGRPVVEAEDVVQHVVPAACRGRRAQGRRERLHPCEDYQEMFWGFRATCPLALGLRRGMPAGIGMSTNDCEYFCRWVSPSVMRSPHTCTWRTAGRQRKLGRSEIRRASRVRKESKSTSTPLPAVGWQSRLVTLC